MIRYSILAVNRSSVTILFIGLLGLFVAGIADAGVNHWTTNGPEGGFIQVLAIDPDTPTTIYAGTNASGVFKSMDGGGSWTAMNTGLTSSIVHALAIDPDTPTTVYAATRGDGVFKSTNGGENWTAMNTGLTGSIGTIYTLAIDPKTPTTVYAAGSAGVVFKSTDGGENWTPMDTGMVYTGWLWVNAVYALAIDPKTPTTVYAGTNCYGAYKTTNGGENWTPIHTGDYVQVLAIDPDTPTTVYAGTGRGLFKSTNGGENWTAMNTGLPSRIVSIHALAIDPGTPTTVYAGTDGGGVFKTTNGGENWTAMNTGLPSNNGNIYALAIDPMTPTTVYAGVYGWGSGAGAGGLFKTTNGGENWTAMNRGLTNTFVQSLAVDPMTPTTVYATACRVFKSTNGGENWTALRRGLKNICVRSLAIDPMKPGTLYAGTWGNSVFKFVAYEGYSVNPEEGTVGTEITITGSGFGGEKGKVLVGTVDLKILEWSDSSIRCQLTRALSPGTYDVSIRPKGSSPIIVEDGFTAIPPDINSTEPISGSTGDEITINGLFFGTKKGKVALGGKTCRVLSWTMTPTTGESEIQFIIPKGLNPGTYELTLTTAKVGSATVNFTVE